MTDDTPRVSGDVFRQRIQRVDTDLWMSENSAAPSGDMDFYETADRPIRGLNDELLQNTALRYRAKKRQEEMWDRYMEMIYDRVDADPALECYLGEDTTPIDVILDLAREAGKRGLDRSNMLAVMSEDFHNDVLARMESKSRTGHNIPVDERVQLHGVDLARSETMPDEQVLLVHTEELERGVPSHQFVLGYRRTKGTRVHVRVTMDDEVAIEEY